METSDHARSETLELSSRLTLIERDRHVLGQIAAGRPLSQVLDSLLRVVEAADGNTMKTSILFVSEDGKHLLHGAGPSLPPEYNAAVHGIAIGEGVGSCGTAVSRGSPVYVTDIATDPLWRDFRELTSSHNLAACWSSPIRSANGTVLGTFAIYYDEPRAPTQEDIELIATVTQTASLAIERYQVEELLRRNQAELRALNTDLERQVVQKSLDRDRIWELSHDMLGIADHRGIWLDVSPAWTRILGWSREEIIGRTSEWIEHPGDRAKTRDEVKSLGEGRPTLSFENRFRTRDGTYRTLSWRAVPEGKTLYCVARDVTEQRAEVAARLQLEEFTQLALTSVGGVGVWNYDIDNDLWVAGDTVANLYGLDPARTKRGIPIKEVIANAIPEDLAELNAVMAGFWLSAGVNEHEFRIQHPDGTVRWVISRGRTHLNANGTSRRAGVSIETTAQHALEEQLRQSQKMEAVGQLTGGMAHDFNNILGGISGSLELAQLRIARGRIEEAERYISAAQEAGKRAAALTHRLLAFSRRQTLEPKLTDPNELLLGMQELVNRTVGPSVEFSLDLEADVWPTLVDRNQLENAVLNLALNARDAMPEGGRIVVTTANRVLNLEAAGYYSLPSGDYVSIAVADNGTGMTKDVIERAFDPFFTTKPMGTGTGLGLSMIFGFAQQSQGQVKIQSTTGEGTAVTVLLPRHVGKIDLTPDIGGAQVPTRRGNETILVVDDEPLIRMTLSDVLKDWGYTVLEAEDGPKAMKVIQSSQRIDLLVSDVGLPNGMNGRQVAEAARQVRPHLKVLFATGYAEGSLLEKGFLDSTTQVITKPFDFERLGTRIRAIIDGTHL